MQGTDHNGDLQLGSDLCHGRSGFIATVAAFSGLMLLICWSLEARAQTTTDPQTNIPPTDTDSCVGDLTETDYLHTTERSRDVGGGMVIRNQTSINLNTALQNLDDLRTRTKEKPKSLSFDTGVQTPESKANAKNMTIDELKKLGKKYETISLTLDLDNIILPLGLGRRANGEVDQYDTNEIIQVVPALENGLNGHTIIVKGTGDKDDHTHGAPPASGTVPLGPKGILCTPGTMLYNPRTQKWERCPEGKILIDSEYTGSHVWDLVHSRDDIIAKAFLTSILAHELAHLWFMTDGDRNGVPRTIENGKVKGSLSDAAHKIVFDFQKYIFDTEYEYYKGITSGLDWKTKLTTKQQQMVPSREWLEFRVA